MLLTAAPQPHVAPRAAHLQQHRLTAELLSAVLAPRAVSKGCHSSRGLLCRRFPSVGSAKQQKHHGADCWIHCALPALPISEKSEHTHSPELHTWLQCSISPPVFSSVPYQDMAMHRSRCVIGICTGDFIRHL